MHRRHFVAGLGTAVVSSVVPGPMETGARASGTGGLIAPLGLQLYTVRDRMRQGVRETLTLVADTGYEEVEFAGYFDHSAEQIRTMLQETGLRSPATHVSLASVREDLANTIAFCQIVGHEYLIVPSLPQSVRGADGYRMIADDFNRIGRACREEGLRFGYHNHDFEFERFGDRSGFDILLDNTDDELVAMELDLFWISRAGADPVEYLEAHPGRFQLCHIKDMDTGGEMVDVGSGTLDFANILAVGARQGLQHYFVEHDRPANSAASIRASYQHLANLRL